MDYKVLFAFALLGLLLFGCAGRGEGTEGGANTGGNAAITKPPLTVDDVGSLEDPDSESMDLGIPLEELS